MMRVGSSGACEKDSMERASLRIGRTMMRSMAA